MAKEPEIPKLGELFIGVIDLFAVLVPGILAAALILTVIGPPPKPDVLFVSGVLIAGWVLGHVLHGLGSFFDFILYDPFFKPRRVVAPGQHDCNHNPAHETIATRLEKKLHFPAWLIKYLRKNDDLHQLAVEQQAKQAGSPPAPRLRDGLMYQWARVWLASHAPQSAPSLDRLEADSKLFRSLTILLFLVMAAIALRGPIPLPLGWKGPPPHFRWKLEFSCLFGLVFSLWRYCDLRHKMVQQCYLSYLQSSLGSADAQRAAGLI